MNGRNTLKNEGIERDENMTDFVGFRGTSSAAVSFAFVAPAISIEVRDVGLLIARSGGSGGVFGPLGSGGNRAQSKAPSISEAQ